MSGPSRTSERAAPSPEPSPSEEPAPYERPRFLVDRMLGPLVRYLRFMGYDTLAATGLGPGGPSEDTGLLRLAAEEGRILLTRDRELARRGGVLVPDGGVLEQVAALARDGLVKPALRLDRCSRCNTPLRPARSDEVTVVPYAPPNPGETVFFWCDTCGRLYWLGSHAARLAERLDRLSGGG